MTASSSDTILSLAEALALISGIRVTIENKASLSVIADLLRDSIVDAAGGPEARAHRQRRAKR